ncbi:holliday junction resolvase [Gordonia phage Pupper]|uniref:Holliday junction resolvase n=1 Tax=Gordonia phage Pupper TaxID=2571249 RepID=A0A4Y6EMK6_9CAUD|nr:Holliday junction resolvase [Gordonia phage Pupper]QDF18641.1 holliday junction resolvase [Gordonia phage Pupper]QDF18873.1 holliday junction resolvase [Gordonia phage SCentae]
MSPKPAWAAFEDDVNDALGLERTAASGSQWHDPGDGVDRAHYGDSDFRLMVDSKYTQGKTYSLSAKFLRDYENRAAEAGRRFALPIRFADKDTGRTDDYIVLSLDDFSELLGKVKNTDG